MFRHACWLGEEQFAFLPPNNFTSELMQSFDLMPRFWHYGSEFTHFRMFLKAYQKQDFEMCCWFEIKYWNTTFTLRTRPNGNMIGLDNPNLAGEYLNYYVSIVQLKCSYLYLICKMSNTIIVTDRSGISKYLGSVLHHVTHKNNVMLTMYAENGVSFQFCGILLKLIDCKKNVFAIHGTFCKCFRVSIWCNLHSQFQFVHFSTVMESQLLMVNKVLVVWEVAGAITQD